jgi:hypothetical protein
LLLVWHSIIANCIRASVASCFAEWIVVICFTSFYESTLDPFSHVCPSLARSIPDLLVKSGNKSYAKKGLVSSTTKLWI